MKKENSSLSGWALRVCRSIVPKILINRQNVPNEEEALVHTESIESYVCAGETIMKDSKGTFRTGSVMVDNVKYADYRVKNIRLYCTLESTYEGLCGGSMMIFLKNLKMIERKGQKSFPVIEIDHIKTRAVEEDGRTRTIRICTIKRFVNMNTGEVCDPDGYPLKDMND